MSKQVLDLLHALSFLENDYSVPNLDGIPQQEIKQRLAYYYASRREGASRELARLRDSKLQDSALISSISAANAVIPLCPTFLVRSSLVVPDPLLALAAPEHEMSKVEQKGLGIEGDDSVDIRQLAQRLQYFSAFAPYIQAEFLHVMPLEMLHEPPKEIPLTTPANRYRELVAADAVEFVNQSAIVRPLEKTARGLVVLDQPNTRLKRHVCITFRGDDAANSASFYHFREFNIDAVGPGRIVKFSYKPWSDEPLDQAQYDIWIEQSVNQTVGARLESISREMRLADALNAPYLTESTFEAELLARSGRPGARQGTPAINFLQANAHLLHIDDPEAIFRLRTEHADLLDRFRLSLTAIAGELKGLSGHEFEQRAQQLFEREVQPQIATLNAAIGKLHSAAAKGLLHTAAALFLGLLSGATLPVAAYLAFAAAGIAAEATPAVGEYQRARRHPQFIWHKLMK